MSCYAELAHARTREEYEAAWADCLFEARRSEYYDRIAEERMMCEDEDDEWEDE